MCHDGSERILVCDTALAAGRFVWCWIDGVTAALGWGLSGTLTGPYAHSGLDEADPAKVTEVIQAVRDAVGPEFTIMVDTQYAASLGGCDRAPAVDAVVGAQLGGVGRGAVGRRG